MRIKRMRSGWINAKESGAFSARAIPNSAAPLVSHDGGDPSCPHRVRAVGYIVSGGVAMLCVGRRRRGVSGGGQKNPPNHCQKNDCCS